MPKAYKNKTQVNAYIPNEIFEKIKAIVEKEGRSYSNVIDRIITKHFEENK